MTKPDGIPQWAWDNAYDTVEERTFEMLPDDFLEMVEHVARAILSAVEQEREACAVEADKHANEPDPDLEDIYDEWGMGLRFSARSIAAHIRSRKDLIDG